LTCEILIKTKMKIIQAKERKNKKASAATSLVQSAVTITRTPNENVKNINSINTRHQTEGGKLGRGKRGTQIKNM